MNEMITVDGNEAAARVAYRLSEVIAIYPITPSSPMAEESDIWAAEDKKNLWGSRPHIVEMQSEAGAVGAVHGSLQRGALTTTFTASQGLLLMIPNMYKIAGELNSTVFHVAARTVATHALSIFCDHSDVMSVRMTGFAMLASATVQEAHDFALIAHAATLRSRVPFLHFFDGFRTSHELAKIEELSLDNMRAMIDDRLVRQHRERALSPDRPFIRGTSQNPDIFFQAREAANPFYGACIGIVKDTMLQFALLTGRRYGLFEYYGSPDAERVIVLIGSGSQVVEETVDYLNERDGRVGLVKVRLFRPFSVQDFLDVIPQSVGSIAVLDRTKEPGSTGEPLYCDCLAAIYEGIEKGRFSSMPKLIGGRYGLSSKEFTPAMVKAVFDELSSKNPHKNFTIGINDDVSGSSLLFDHNFSLEPSDRLRAVFYGAGSDGTVGANKNTIKIIGEGTRLFAQGYFIYDSMKSGSITVSNLRFGPEPIRSAYAIHNANFIACHQFQFLERVRVLEYADEGALFLLNSPYSKEQVWDKMPRAVQEIIIRKKLRVHVIDAYGIARELGLGGRINTVMQTCFFMLTSLMPTNLALDKVKIAIKKTYGNRGESVVAMNIGAVERALGELYELEIPNRVTSTFDMRPPVPSDAPSYVKGRTAPMIAGLGDDLPVSAFEPDGTFPSGTLKYMKRNITLEMPVWDPEVCIQCGRCSLMCPHAVIRAKFFDSSEAVEMPSAFKTTAARLPSFKGKSFAIAVSPDDCTGCRVCVEVCPARSKQEPKHKAINMEPQSPIRVRENENWQYFLSLPESDRVKLKMASAAEIQALEPLFEFSGACAGCGETPYLILLSRLFGDRAIIANATGCSSIYGGNQPATPWTFNKEGRGPAWSNSLFENNAEFGLGFRLALDKQIEYAWELLSQLTQELGRGTVEELVNSQQNTEIEISDQRNRVESLKEKLKSIDRPEARSLLSIADVLVKKSVWMVGGDGWAYDIGFGGLDHVLSLGKKVNILVLDTEVYSNTGGQMSKATPPGAVAKFAARGKETSKKDLAMIAMTYGAVYVAKVAMGADMSQTIKAFSEAEDYPGTSLIIAYSQCIGHGYDLAHGMDQQKKAVQSGYWPLMRFNPKLIKEGKNPLQLDSGSPSLSLDKYIYNETRYKMLLHGRPHEAAKLYEKACEDVDRRWKLYKYWAAMNYSEELKHD